ncbi:MAG: hypothetical protein MPN21_17745 [Thermoanaerobaculia bacterium]|nr:hypothetical protein [Thermoanaerobaculia bacterium]
MNPEPVTREELLLVARTVARLRAVIVALVTGMVCGFGLFAATLWLVIKGGKVVGPTLGLLRVYYPGYSVTWGGSFVGLFYGALTGAALGFCVASLYNALARWRGGRL